MVETKIQQISAAHPRPSNGTPLKDLIQESVKSIVTLFEEKATDSGEESVGSVKKGDSKVDESEDPMPISESRSKAILSQHWNPLGKQEVPTIQCELGPFNVHHALCDRRESMNIMPKMVYDYLNEDPLVSVPYSIPLVDTTRIQP